MSESVQPIHNPRTPGHEIDAMFIDRWSPRAFREEPIPREMVMRLFEAARWAPSSYNEQPWRLIYATSDEDRQRFLSILVEGNRKWASRAPLLIFIIAKRRFDKNQKPNKHYAFDCGAAWMSLALQARKLGLYAHGMAGFDEEMAYEALRVSKDDYEVMAGIAVGWRDDPAVLPEEIAAREAPNDRKPLARVAMEGRFQHGVSGG